MSGMPIDRRKRNDPTPPPIDFAEVYIKEGVKGVECYFRASTYEFALWFNWPGFEHLEERRIAYLKPLLDAAESESP